jgi:hypothetical protein
VWEVAAQHRIQKRVTVNTTAPSTSGQRTAQSVTKRVLVFRRDRLVKTKYSVKKNLASRDKKDSSGIDRKPGISPSLTHPRTQGTLHSHFPCPIHETLRESAFYPGERLKILKKLIAGKMSKLKKRGAFMLESPPSPPRALVNKIVKKSKANASSHAADIQPYLLHPDFVAYPSPSYRRIISRIIIRRSQRARPSLK